MSTTALNGTEHERIATIEKIAARGASVRLGEELAVPARDPTSPCMLAVALADLGRMDVVVEKAAELGATAVRVFRASRSQIGDVAPSRLARWRRIARAGGGAADGSEAEFFREAGDGAWIDDAAGDPPAHDQIALACRRGLGHGALRDTTG